ncbi:hypothetical protein BHF71_01130 [Vulcanibacillus modesticaldus]|uniref:M23ase beta-sheet core domain-containing protein n=1 Tax=Vulcanibacillus modesticaldus TaxID=337097 RepID=A0A1D2YVQ6_9BACI|nr:M23 family metallopeptidase [Vulcanibacillus modesticaldus]OEF99808.1 hypothetical protein BHF71_01130 [Vulcanibacillus modesticaldus]
MSANFKWKKLLAKKWTYPALYLIAAALILALMWWYQDPNEYPLTSDDLGLEEINPVAVGELSDNIIAKKLGEDLGEAIAVTNSVNIMKWPVEDQNEVAISMGFFDKNATVEEMENAIVTFQNELLPHTGIDIVSKNGEAFNVVAALSGEVVRAEKDPVVGYVVELSHDQGLVTYYSSIAELKVEKGDTVSQGDILGVASRNIFEKDQGVHLHFEVRKDEVVQNPQQFLNRDISQVVKDEDGSVQDSN